MGYTTDFSGRVEIEPPLNAAEIDFLTDLASTRRMRRTKGPLYVKGAGDFGQGDDDDILDHNRPDSDQPGLWCQWAPEDDGAGLEWDGGEKFYNSAEWMKYIVQNLLAPEARAYVDAHLSEDDRLAQFTCNHVVNGEILAQGEDPDDRWALIVTDNRVLTAGTAISYTTAKEV